MGLANEIVPEGKAYERALELARSIAKLPQGALRSDKETMPARHWPTVGGTTAS